MLTLKPQIQLRLPREGKFVKVDHEKNKFYIRPYCDRTIIDSAQLNGEALMTSLIWIGTKMH